MNLTVVIIHYKAPDLFARAVQSILDIYPELSGHFVFIDNSPNNESRKKIRDAFANELYVPSRHNVGFAKACNWGMYNADTKYILLLNQDMVIKGDAIKILYDHMEQHQGVAISAAKLLNRDSSTQQSCMRFYTPKTILYRRTVLGKLPMAKKTLNHLTMEDYDHRHTKAVDWVMGACMMVRRQALQQIGAMDERFFFYFEDVDWCRRFWQAGWKVHYVPSAIMTHYHKRESAEQIGFLSVFNRMTRVHIFSGFRYFMKYWFSDTTLQQDKKTKAELKRERELSQLGSN